MNHTEAIKLIMKQSGLEQVDIAERIGIARTSVTMRINRKRARLYNIVELLDAMGYEMVAMPRNGPPLPKGTYAISREDYL